MAVAVAPTLRRMVEILSLSTVGGDRSDRFVAYVDACASGELLHGYNPMTTQPVTPVLEALLDLDAEQIILDAGRETLHRLGVDDDLTLFLSVTAPGMWTDRRATMVDHGVAPRHEGEILVWFDDRLDASDLRIAAVEQTVRAVWWRARRERQQPPTLAEAAEREGIAGAMAGRSGRSDSAAAELLDVLGEDDARATVVAYLFGNDAARALGYEPLGLTGRQGLDHSIAQAGQLRMVSP